VWEGFFSLSVCGNKNKQRQFDVSCVSELHFVSNKKNDFLSDYFSRAFFFFFCFFGFKQQTNQALSLAETRKFLKPQGEQKAKKKHIFYSCFVQTLSNEVDPSFTLFNKMRGFGCKRESMLLEQEKKKVRCHKIKTRCMLSHLF